MVCTYTLPKKYVKIAMSSQVVFLLKEKIIYEQIAYWKDLKMFKFIVSVYKWTF